MSGLLITVSLPASESAQIAEQSSSTVVVVLAVVVFVGTYVLIAAEWVHRVAAALIGAALMVVIGATDATSAFFTEDTAIDWNVIFLLLGMMIVVSVLRLTGLFDYLAIWSAKRARGRPFTILAMLCTITAVASAMLPNVTTVMLVAPVTLLVCDRLRVRPEGFLIALVMASNIGGTATLIGDPPNLIIASKGNLSFNDFLIHLTPFIVAAFAAFVLLSRWLFREAFTYDTDRVEAIMRIDERRAIRDPALLRRSLAVLALIILGFVLGSTIDVEPSLVAMLGAGLLVVVSRTATSDYLADVEWPTLVFFMGLFVLVGALVDVGVIDTVGEAAIEAVGDDYLLAATGLLFGSAALSAIIDNIPYVATVAPLVADLVDASDGAPQATALWWALALGADLGGNATAVGASANVVALGIAERNGFPISFWRFTRYGLVVTVVTVAMAWPYLYLRYYAFS
jgi:Na+/H+ antiporter NhaD/arsenite permease-like protein